MANAKDLAGQVVLAPGQGNVKPLFHPRANLLRIYPLGHDGGDRRAGAVVGSVEREVEGGHGGAGGSLLAIVAGKDRL